MEIVTKSNVYEEGQGHLPSVALCPNLTWMTNLTTDADACEAAACPSHKKKRVKKWACVNWKCYHIKAWPHVWEECVLMCGWCISCLLGWKEGFWKAPGLWACPEGRQLWGRAGNGGHLGPAWSTEGQRQPSEGSWRGQQQHRWEENAVFHPPLSAFPEHLVAGRGCRGRGTGWQS